MPRVPKPFITPRRNDAKTYQISLNPSSGLPERICQDWKRRGFQDFPPEPAQYRYPRTKSAAEAGAFALIEYLKRTGEPVRISTQKITVGAWLEKFIQLDGNPRAARNLAKNRPYSPQSVNRLKGLYENHMKDDPFMNVLMVEVEPVDALELISRIGRRELQGRYKKKEEKPQMAGSETFNKLVKFLRMAFKEYGKNRPGWYNAFQDIEPPRAIRFTVRDALPEEEVIKLFQPGVLLDKMERAICAAMFLAGLRRSEIFALRPEDLDWFTPKITVSHAWQNFSYRKRNLGPTKSKRERIAPFDKVLQEAIRDLWQENGQHGFVFVFKDGKTPGPSWIKGRFKKWLARAGIELNGRQLVPHSSRHSLASILEARGVSLRYIQDLLDHSDLKTTKNYLHSTKKTIREIGTKIDSVIEGTAPVLEEKASNFGKVG
ncbi:MAG: site-specific integrase [Treponema sp.]|jgi:integrase|nr:site-specific integrase [Treponema sp.]